MAMKTFLAMMDSREHNSKSGVVDQVYLPTYKQIICWVWEKSIYDKFGKVK